MAEPTIGESARFLRRMLTAGTVRRLDLLHGALCSAYQMGAEDQQRQNRGEPMAESCLEN